MRAETPSEQLFFTTTSRFAKGTLDYTWGRNKIAAHPADGIEVELGAIALCTVGCLAECECGRRK